MSVAITRPVAGVLIEELRRFSRFGPAGMNFGIFDMTSVAAAATREHLEQARALEVALIVWPLPSSRCDARLLQHVYGNLVSNAIKFTCGRPGARVDICSHFQNGQSVYDVIDNGIGFDVRNANKVFGGFWHLNIESHFEGVGLGLALVQWIIHRHDGCVWADSEPGRGAAFHFTLGGGR